MRFHIDDDSGILGLLDCSAYSPFVGEDWTYDQIISHFRSQAARKSIVVWDAGDGGNLYRIDLRIGTAKASGYREALSQISVRDGRLHFASYTALTMAAQYADESLPAKYETDYVFSIANGDYSVRIVQAYDPDDYTDPSEDEPHFIVEIYAVTGKEQDNVLWLKV